MVVHGVLIFYVPMMFSVEQRTGQVLSCISPSLSPRALFIIDGNGIVRSSMVNDIPVGRSVDEVLRLVKAFQFTDIHGEVCPEGWSHGESSVSE